MAEARSVASFSADLQQSAAVHFLGDKDGYTFTIHIPSIRKWPRRVSARLHSWKNKLVNAVYPMGIGIYVLLAMVAVGIVTFVPEDSWWRTGELSQFAWWFLSLFPYFTQLSEMQRTVLVTTVGAFGYAFIIAVIQRYLLRALLSYRGMLYLNPGDKSYMLPVWAVLVKLLSGSKPTTFACQESLPRLSVPSLQSTVDRYLSSLKPILDLTEFERVEGLAQQFITKEGPSLQRYANLISWFSKNYVSEFWEKYVYLRSRDPIVINSNYYALDQATYTETTNQVARAARLTHYLADFAKQLKHEQIPPIMLRGMVPLCMSQVGRVLSTCRVPRREIDVIEHWELGESRHVVVIYKGSYYSLNVFDQSGSVLEPWQLEDLLQMIVRDADSLESHRQPSNAEANVSVLTGLPRTEWATVRETHFGSGLTYAVLRTVESALFVLHLSEVEPASWTEQGSELLHGNGKNVTWYDKSVCMTVFANGRAGLNCEHAWGDATIIAHMWEWTCLTGHLHGRKFKYTGAGTNERPEGATLSSSTTVPKRLDWHLTPAAERIVLDAMPRAQEFASNLDLQVINHNAYGKGFVKKCKVSPDAYLQMALQLAYKLDQGKLAMTYESAMTRLYREGRTETVRPVTVESAAWVKAMLDKDATKEEKITKLRAAAVKHVQNNRDAMCGKLCDRHLFVLYVISVGRGQTSEFLEDALARPWVLSTSQQPQRSTERWDPNKNPEHFKMHGPGGGFGPVSDQGYGVSYMIAGEESFYFHISSKKACAETDSTRFGQKIQEALAHMHKLFDTKTGTTPAKATQADRKKK